MGKKRPSIWGEDRRGDNEEVEGWGSKRDWCRKRKVENDDIVFNIKCIQ